MNAQKEVEYIAEIVRLKSELKKSQVIIGQDMLSKNSDLLLVANQCIEQIKRNTDGKACFELTDWQTTPMRTGKTEHHSRLTAEVVSIESI